MLFRKELAVYHKHDITKLNDVIKEINILTTTKIPSYAIESVFTASRRRLHRLTKVSS